MNIEPELIVLSNCVADFFLLLEFLFTIFKTFVSFFFCDAFFTGHLVRAKY